MAKMGNRASIPKDRSFTDSAEIAARDKVTFQNPDSHFTQIGANGGTSANLASPKPKDISGAYKLGSLGGGV